MSLFSNNSGGSGTKSDDYFRITDGETIKIRILCDEFTEGWQYYTVDKKPRHFPPDKRPQYAEYVDEIGPGHEGQPGAPKPFAAVAVYDYGSGSVKVWTITQKTIVFALEQLQQDPDFGIWTKYDIKITRANVDKKTTYSCLPLPPSRLSAEITAKINAKPWNLKAIYENKNPFKFESEPQPRPVNLVPENADDIPF